MKTLFEISPCLKIGLMLTEDGYKNLQEHLQGEIEEASNRIVELSKEIKNLEKQLLKEEKKSEKQEEKKTETKKEEVKN